MSLRGAKVRTCAHANFLPRLGRSTRSSRAVPDSQTDPPLPVVAPQRRVRPVALPRMAKTRPLWLLLALPVPIFVVAAVVKPHTVLYTDFASYYYTALAWRTGVPVATLLPRQPSLSPPTLSIALWPLTFLPLLPAYAAWLGINLVAVVGTFRVLDRRGLLPASVMLWAVIGTIMSVPAFLAWWLGQVTWIVAYAVTLAWDARSPWQAGAWLALGIAIKPPLALMVLALPAGTWGPAGALSVAISLCAVAITGWQPWAEWLATTGGVWWIDLAANVSFWSIPARFQAGHPTLGQMVPWGWAFAIALSALLYAACLRERGDYRWLFAGLFGVLASPIGWVHYFASLLAPLLVTWPRNRWSTAAVVLLCCPHPVMDALVPSGLGTWIYTVGAWCLLMAYVLRGQR